MGNWGFILFAFFQNLIVNVIHFSAESFVHLLKYFLIWKSLKMNLSFTGNEVSFHHAFSFFLYVPA